MKPFNLEAAKAGAPIITRDGREARFIAHVPGALADYKVVWCGEDGVIRCCAENGAWSSDGIARCTDLFMKPQKRTVWVNLYHPAPSGRILDYEAVSHSSEESARASALEGVVAMAIPIEIEE